MALNAIYTGVTGLTANAQLLDVVGNNLANNNTTGFKAQRALFKDLVYQTIAAGSAASADQGSVNPSQIGFGVAVGTIHSVFQQGTLNPTGRTLDLGIQGSGFFVLANSSSTYYSRAGAFDVDSAGFLVDQTTGNRVQRFGIVGEGPGGFQVTGENNIRIPFGAGLPGTPTANVTMQGNISSTLAVGESVSTAIQVFDTQATMHSLNVTFTKTAADTFSIAATVSGGTVTVPPGNITFDANGLLVGPSTIALTLNGLPGPQTVTLQLGNPGSANGLTQFGGTSSAAAVAQDGFSAGTLNAVSVDTSGIIQGLFSNGRTVALAQLALSRFNNETGLLREGNNFFSASPASGTPLTGTAGTGARGAVIGGTLEGSNVDIAQEFSRLILAQRGFQINARVITVGNDVLQELSTIIR